MEKESFVFYRSFNDAIRLLPEKFWGTLYAAVAEYALDGKEPTGLPNECMALFILMRPVLDSNAKRAAAGAKGAEHGKKGGRPRKNVKEEQEEATPAEVNDCEQVSAEPNPATSESHSDTAETPAPPAQSYNATYEEEIKRLHTEDMWIEQSICMRYKVDKQTASLLIDAYYRYLIGECSEEKHRNFGHAKSHFHSWYRKALKAGFSLDDKPAAIQAQNVTPKKTSRTADYTFDGGFGGQDN